MVMKDGGFLEGLTFDDVLLVPGKSSVLPAEVDTRTNFTRKIQLNIPLVSAAMDTVTESRLAIAIARQGGIGIIHRNMSVERQAEEVDRVKRSESGMIVDPVTISAELTVRQATDIMAKYRISGLPVTRGTKLVGILTNRDLRFEKNLDQPVGNVMTKEKLVTVPVGTTLEEAEKILQKHRIEKLLVVDKDFNLKGLITVKDIQKKLEFPNATKDEHGRLRCGAAIGATRDYLERAQELSRQGVDVLAIDTAHGHSTRVMEAITAVKHALPEMQLVAGNVGTFEGAKDLVALGLDGIKVGIGPGSICTTRIVTGAGVPQITAILEAARATQGSGCPIIADGGIKYSGDITKAIAAGASVVMMGGLFAGTEESPGETILYQGRTFKSYRGMGSIAATIAAMEQGGTADRYAQETTERGKTVPEGVEGRVPYKGALGALVEQLVGGLKSGMGYCGVPNIAELQERARFLRISTAGLRESHVHDVVITREAPNYRVE
jgi:IMP dehydrogenase|nr:IMP dehydrogenase [Candidatus Acidoferrales bacterium]